MSAWDDPITHIRELEARLSRVKALADEWEKWDAYALYNYGVDPGGREYARILRDALEGR